MTCLYENILKTNCQWSNQCLANKALRLIHNTLLISEQNRLLSINVLPLVFKLPKLLSFNTVIIFHIIKSVHTAFLDIPLILHSLFHSNCKTILLRFALSSISPSSSPSHLYIFDEQLRLWNSLFQQFHMNWSLVWRFLIASADTCRMAMLCA